MLLSHVSGTVFTRVKIMDMSIICIGVTVYPVFCVGLYFTECVYVLSCFILAYCFLSYVFFPVYSAVAA